MAEIDAIFTKLIEKNGSDLHLEEGQKPKIRLFGHLEPLEEFKVLTKDYMTELLQEIVDPAVWRKYQETGDVDFAYSFGQEARFRGNYYRHFFGYGAVFRIIPSKIRSMEQLELPPVMKTLAELRSGLVVVTGPTGSGKSTTLAAIIDHINANYEKKIVTIEEPVEFMHQNKKSIITHREVGLDTTSFASGLRSALKSDVDVILVGEMRDQETIELALTASEIGVLVFGTLHTNSAAKTIDRIIDVFPPNKQNQIRTILANSLRGIIAQQLLRSSDGAGRYAAFEILLRTTALATIIRSGETIKLVSEIQLNRGRGMVLMDDSLMQLVRSGKVTREDAYMKALDKSKFVNPIPTSGVMSGNQ